MRTNKGIDRGSIPIYRLDIIQPVSDDHLIQVKLIKAIIRLWSVVVVQSHLDGVSQIVGKSIIVGIKIFSIVVNLGLVGDLCRGFELWRLVVLGLHWPHMLKRPVGE